MYPWKRWHVKSDPFGNNTEKAVEFFSPASQRQRASGRSTGRSRTWPTKRSAIPKFMTGSPPTGGLGRTAVGPKSMLMQNSSKILQTVASNVDIDVIDPVINALLDMVMLTDQTGLLTGEEKVRVLGVQVAQQRETQRARQLEFLQLTANPIDMSDHWTEGAGASSSQVATEIGLPGENIVPSDEEMDQKEKATASDGRRKTGAAGPPGACPHWRASGAAGGRPSLPVKAGRRSSPQHASPRPRHASARAAHPPAHPARAGNQG